MTSMKPEFFQNLHDLFTISIFNLLFTGKRKKINFENGDRIEVCTSKQTVRSDCYGKFKKFSVCYALLNAQCMKESLFQEVFLNIGRRIDFISLVLEFCWCVSMILRIRAREYKLSTNKHSRAVFYSCFIPPVYFINSKLL